MNEFELWEQEVRERWEMWKEGKLTPDLFGEAASYEN